MARGQVKIGPEFFGKVKKDYADWRWAFVREIVSNGIDAGAGQIDVKLIAEGDRVQVSVQNDGSPMTKSTLVDKLLNLGGSTKDGGASIGGFGAAKLILYFCHDSYVIESGSLRVDGVGADYEITEVSEPLGGTRSTVVMDGPKSDIERAFMQFASCTQWSGTLTLDGEVLETSLRKGSPRRQFKFGKVYTNLQQSHRLIVRHNGVPMFRQYVSTDKCVLVELDGNSTELLTSNRDGLNDKHRQELWDFVTSLAVDVNSALTVPEKKWLDFGGRYLTASFPSSVTEAIAAFVAATKVVVVESEGSEGSDVEPPATKAVEKLQEELREELQSFSSKMVEKFLILNETSLEVPSYYRPDCDMSTHASKLAMIWGRLLLQLHVMEKDARPFQIGFVFSESSLACYSGERAAFLLNPAKLVSQSASASRSFKKRYKLTDRAELLSIAAHEYVHRDHSPHDEEYARRLTHLMGRVLKNVKDFNWCFVGL